jgi:hypothetical protein
MLRHYTFNKQMTDANCRFGEPTCTDAVAHELLQIPALFGRLARIAARYDPFTDQYRDEELGRTFGEESAHQVLKKVHLDLFQEWLCRPLASQVEDLQAYLSQRLEVEWEIVLTAYAGRYDRLAPAETRSSELELFGADLGISLRLAMGQPLEATTVARHVPAPSEWAMLYCLGRLTPEQQAQFESHCLTCQACAEAVRSTYEIIEGLPEGLYPKRGPGGGTPPRRI